MVGYTHPTKGPAGRLRLEWRRGVLPALEPRPATHRSRAHRSACCNVVKRGKNARLDWTERRREKRDSLAWVTINYQILPPEIGPPRCRKPKSTFALRRTPLSWRPFETISRVFAVAGAPFSIAPARADRQAESGLLDVSHPFVRARDRQAGAEGFVPLILAGKGRASNVQNERTRSSRCELKVRDESRIEIRIRIRIRTTILASSISALQRHVRTLTSARFPHPLAARRIGIVAIVDFD